jgi:hypothetical protein
MGEAAMYWVMLTYMVILVFVYGTWKYGVLEKVHAEES